MKRSRRMWTVPGLAVGVGFIMFGCIGSTNDGTPGGHPGGEEVTQVTGAAHAFCGNNRCDHGETCSSCPRDCGTCGSGGTTGTGGSGTGGTTGTGGGATGGATGTGGSGTGVCGSNAAPPAQYQHVVIFSLENRTWSNVGLGFSPTTMPYLHSLASQCSFFSDWTETNTTQGRDGEPQRSRLLRHRGPPLHRARRRQSPHLRLRHAHPLQRRPRLR